MDGENIILLGVSHRRTPFARLEKAAVPKALLPQTLAELKGWEELEEVCVVSTCSRVEVAAVSQDPQRALARLRGWFSERLGSDEPSVLYALQGQPVLRHLVRLAAGLDSWIVGESEILHQIKEAYAAAQALRATGPLLNRTFQMVFSAGKTVRTATGLQNGIRSIGGAAALLAKKIFGEINSGRAVLFGAGQVTEAVVRHLAAKNFKDIWVANRTFDKARGLAAALGGTACSWEEGFQKLAEVEVAMFSTACPRFLLDEASLRPVMGRRTRPLFLIDLGLPRNVDPVCARMEGVYLYDLSDLKNMVQESMSDKAAIIQKGEDVAAAEAFECWRELKRAAARRKEAALSGAAQ